jgi:hypothetical protein
MILEIFFKYTYTKNRHSFIISGDYIKDEVIRSEGDINIKLKIDELIIEENDYNIHNDHLALIAILSFFPVIPKEICKISFNFKVSKEFQNAINTYGGLPNVFFDTDDLGLYKNEGECISFGGGFDSTAISVLLPEIEKIQQINMNENVNSLTITKIKSNIRDMYTRWGLPVWVSIFVVPMIKNVKYILSGSQYNSSYLGNGKGYNEIFNNRWYKLFESLNIKILPCSFLSEITTAEIIVKSNKFDDTEFCYFTSRKKCNRCTKCLRKYLEASIFNSKYIEEINKFDLSDDSFKKLFDTDWLYFGDCFKYSIDILKNIHKESKNLIILEQYLSKYEISDVSYLIKFYEKDFSNISYPNHISEKIKQGLKKYSILPMTIEDEENFKNFKNIKL